MYVRIKVFCSIVIYNSGYMFNVYTPRSDISRNQYYKFLRFVLKKDNISIMLRHVSVQRTTRKANRVQLEHQ